jgi:hypothetical protein
VINPGRLSRQIAVAMLGAGLSHSRIGHPRPMHPRVEMLGAMLAAGRDAWRSDSRRAALQEVDGVVSSRPGDHYSNAR